MSPRIASHPRGIFRLSCWKLALGALTALGGCKPELGAPPSLITTSRLLDLRSTPAEAKPGTAVVLDALLVGPEGILSPPVAWTPCRSPKPPAEGNAVSRLCVDQPDDGAAQDGPATITVPADACTLFGPLTPPAQPGQAAIRPRDPDPTGGFYQPIRGASRDLAAAGADLLGFAMVRVSCALANAPADVARQFNDPNNGYHANQAPTPFSVSLIDETGMETIVAGAGAGDPTVVRAGTSVTLRTSWGSEAAETFPLFDVKTRQLVTAREALRVSWFATDGELVHDRTGREADDPELTSDNVWNATVDRDRSVTVHFWIVLRDNRGGSDFATFDLQVLP